MPERPPCLPPESTGFPGVVEVVTSAAGRRPLTLDWMSAELIAETRRVWSRRLRRVVTEDEAVEMLANVKAAAEAILATTGAEIEE